MTAVRILVTGFEPFGGDSENASREAVLRLAETWRDDLVEVVVGILPVAFATAPAALRELVEAHRPAAVLAVGEAGSRTAVTPERAGRNRMDARIADNLGDRPLDLRIDDGPELRPSAFDVDDMVRRVRGCGIPAEVSTDAGGFLCNRVAVEVGDLDIPGGFVHVPAVRTVGVAGVGAETDPGAAPAHSDLTVDDLARALGECVRSVVGVSQGGSVGRRRNADS